VARKGTIKTSARCHCGSRTAPLTLTSDRDGAPLLLLMRTRSLIAARVGKSYVTGRRQAWPRQYVMGAQYRLTCMYSTASRRLATNW
jgi:hypothetical protein